MSSTLNKDLDASAAYAADAERFARYVEDAVCDALITAGWDPDRAVTADAPAQLRVADGEAAGDVLDRLARVHADTLVLIHREGDRPSPFIASLLAAKGLLRHRLVLFDLYVRSDERVIPYFLPGINYVHALNADYFRSRFLVRGADLVEYLQYATKFSARELSLSVLSKIYETRSWGSVAHLSMPLMEINEAENCLRVERLRLIERSAKTPFVYELDELTRRASAVPVSVIISTKDRGHLLGQLVRALLALPAAKLAEVVLVSNRTSNPYALRTLDELATRERVKLIHYGEPFNFSAQANLGARASASPLLVFMNDDIVPASKGWLDSLLEPFSNARVGIAGPLLLYPDERVQHCGMYLGCGMLYSAGHTLRFARLPEQDYMFLGTAPRQVTCVTGAVLAIRRELFEQLNGFDESFASVLQDVDLCLRAHYSDREIVFNPRAVFLHSESASVAEQLAAVSAHELRREEHVRFQKRWGRRLAVDPFHPNFDSSDETLTTLRRS